MPDIELIDPKKDHVWIILRLHNKAERLFFEYFSKNVELTMKQLRYMISGSSVQQIWKVIDGIGLHFHSSIIVKCDARSKVTGNPITILKKVKKVDYESISGIDFVFICLD